MSSEESSNDFTDNYQVYLAGGLFSQHDLSANVSLKEAVWRLSKGRFELVLPQSKELRQLDTPNLAAYLRNEDVKQAIQADILLARFDGAELDSGMIVEFMIAKMLGKPSVIIRTDSRHLTTEGLDDPFNLMVKNWPRTQVVYTDALIDYTQRIAAARESLHDADSGGQFLEAEIQIIQKSTDALAEKVIEALNAVIEIESPYPPELREALYEAVRYTPGAGFDQLLPEDRLKSTLAKLRKHKTL